MLLISMPYLYKSSEKRMTLWNEQFIRRSSKMQLQNALQSYTMDCPRICSAPTDPFYRSPVGCLAYTSLSITWMIVLGTWSREIRINAWYRLARCQQNRTPKLASSALANQRESMPIIQDRKSGLRIKKQMARIGPQWSTLTDRIAAD